MLTAEHKKWLTTHAVDIALAERLGVRSVLTQEDIPEEWRGGLGRHTPGVMLPWTSYDGRVSVQLHPDTPPTNTKGEKVKYLFRKAVEPVLWAVRVNPWATKILIVEGSKQCLVAAAYAPPEYNVFGIAGCYGWLSDGSPIADLRVVKGRDTTICFDADATSNPEVYEAGVRLAEALKPEGCGEIKWLRLPAGKSAGLDDVLAKRAPEHRAEYLAALISDAKDKIADKLPRAKKKVKTGPGAEYFDDGAFLVEKLTRKVIEVAPAALTPERKIAMYVNGVYQTDGLGFSRVVAREMGDTFRPFYRAACEEFASGLLDEERRYLPERVEAPLLNLTNGMLNLLTGELLPHSPNYMSGVQLPVAWEPEATCPSYEKWLGEVVPDQIQDLEETCSMMLDPSRTPTKACFLYGPSRSGKSTWLRLLLALVGRHYSAVTLHQLSNDKFAAANIWGAVLNAAADLSSAHVDDLSIFKMLTGEDKITANRKYGHQFSFTNRALFAFSANELPTVGESSRAYSERIKPFKFGVSFAGHEDPAIERAMLTELPGILSRLVRAWQRRTARGTYLDTAAEIRADFEQRSDRVRLWVAERCRIIRRRPDGEPLVASCLLPFDQMNTKRHLARLFNDWAQEQGGSAMRMGERKVIERLTSIDGVIEVRCEGTKAKGLNVVLRSDDHDDHDDGGGVALSTPSFPSTSIRSDLEATSDGGVLGEDGSESATPPPVTPETETQNLMIFDLETGSAAELHSAGPEWLRLGGWSDGTATHLTTDFGSLARRVQHAHVVTGHNVMGYDLLALARHHGVDILELTRRGAVFDTLLAARFVDPPMAREKGVDAQRRYDLDSLGRKYELGGKTGNLAGLKKEFGGYDKIPVDDPRYREYLTGDVELSRALYLKLHELVGDSAYLKREHRVAAVAARMTMNGFRVDLELLNERLAHNARLRDLCLERLHERYGIPLNDDKDEPYASPLATRAGKDALIAALVKHGVREGSWWTTGKTSDIATSRDAMQHLAAQYPTHAIREICLLVAKVVTLRSVYTTVQSHLVGDRVHPSVTMKQSTGRWSLTKPGMTVMGKRNGKWHEREIFLAEPGHVVIAVDLSQVDMRAIAGLSGDLGYIEMLRHEDPHAEIARVLFGDPSMREVAKPIGHGWNYGRGVKAIANDNDLPGETVLTFDKEMRARFPRLVAWQDEVRHIAESGELLDNGFGRKMRPDPSRSHTQGPALCGQGGARDLMMTGLLRLPDEVLPMLRAQVHDEIVLSVPAADAVEIQAAVIEALSFDWEGPGGTVPIVAEGGPCDRTSWGQVYAKEAA
jgi:P4 family phage/plasmid primase-like protien